MISLISKTQSSNFKSLKKQIKSLKKLKSRTSTNSRVFDDLPSINSPSMRNLKTSNSRQKRSKRKKLSIQKENKSKKIEPRTRFYSKDSKFVNKSPNLRTLQIDTMSSMNIRKRKLSLNHDKKLSFMKNAVIKFNSTKSKCESLKTNSNFKDTYKVLKLLGNGSNSNVYLARNRETRRLFAVKKLSKNKISDTSNDLLNFRVGFGYWDNWKNEITCLKRLKYQNCTTQLVNVYNEKTCYLMVMSYEGESNLKVFLEKNPLLSVNFII